MGQSVVDGHPYFKVPLAGFGLGQLALCMQCLSTAQGGMWPGNDSQDSAGCQESACLCRREPCHINQCPSQPGY